MKYKSLEEFSLKMELFKAKLKMHEFYESVKQSDTIRKNPPKGQFKSDIDPYGEEDWTD